VCVWVCLWRDASTGLLTYYRLSWRFDVLLIHEGQTKIETGT
jgi:hypothetical protein